MSAAGLTHYSEILRHLPLRRRLRRTGHDAAVFVLSATRRLSRQSPVLQFLNYHHIFDDERQGFSRQLAYLKRFGEFVTLDQAIELLSVPGRLSGRHFCLTFDDGFRNCFTNALPILAEHSCPAAFFVPTDFIGLDLERDWQALAPFYERAAAAYPRPIAFLTWEECRQMQDAGLTFGSHTCTHARLADLTDEAAREELQRSRQRLEAELGRPCRHFGCPQGFPIQHYLPDRDPALARELGYASFLTSRRGPNRPGDDLYALRRDRMLAGWGNYQLRYFLGVE